MHYPSTSRTERQARSLLHDLRYFPTEHAVTLLEATLRAAVQRGRIEERRRNRED